MKLKLYFSAVCLMMLSLINNLHGQTSQKIIPVSPEAAALAKMVNYPINKNTGIPGISIPFYTIEIGGLTLPVNIVYQGGGFKINEHATRVGLGWNLSCNLQITRSINGLDDFEPGVGYIENTLMKAYNPSSPYNGSYFNQGDPDYWYREYDLAAGTTDGEPDKFNYNLLGKSGSFYFMKNTAGNGYTIVPVPYDNIKITYDNMQFIILDTDGTTYYFGEQGTGGDLPQLGREVTGVIDHNGGCYNCNVTAWKCMRIESSTSSNTINFTYQAQTVTKYRFYNDRIEYYDNEDPCALGVAGGEYFHSNESPLSYKPSYESILGDIPFYRISSPKYMVYYGNGQPILHVPSFDEDGNLTDKTYEKGSYFPSAGMDIAGLSLSQIEFRGGKVVFNGSDELTTINVKDDHNNTIKSASLYQSYKNALYSQEAQSYNGFNFQGTPYLDSLHIGNEGNTFERYAFLYNDKFCFGNHLKGHDAWGYPNESTVEIAYANNTSSNILSIPSKRIIQQRYYDDLTGGCNYHLVEPFVIGGDDWAEQPNEQDMKRGTLKRIIYPTGGFVDFDWEANKYLETFDNGDIDYDYYQELPRLGGGLRIRSISHFDGKNLQPEMQMYYRYGDLEDGTGILINRPRQGLGAGTYHYEAEDYDQQVAYLSAPNSPPSLPDLPPCYNKECLSVKTVETKTTYQPASSLNYTYGNGAPIYYTKVAIYKKDLGIQSGKTVYEYYPPEEFMTYSPTLYGVNRIPGTPLSYLTTDGLMGAEKSESQYTYDLQNGYQLIHRKNFEYDRFLKSLRIRVAYAFFHVLYEVVDGNYSGDNRDLYDDSYYDFSFSPSSLENDYVEGQYDIPVGKLLLSKVTEETFEGSNALTQTTEYYYDNPSYLQPSSIEHYDSKDNLITKTIKYPYDLAGIYNQMVANNIIDIPIEVTETNTSLGEEISKKKTNYGHIQTGWGFFAPVSVQTSYGGGPLVTDVTFDQYDQYGNILQRTLRNGARTSYLWGYNDLYPVAKLEGVKYSQISSNFLSNVQINNPSSDGALHSLLDNLRNSFNGNERITTYTYKRLTGITSKTIPNDYTTYYEYDPIGRLVDQKDNDQHVVKTYAYNMIGPSSNGLNTWYVNYPMMETYNEDCGSGDIVAYNYVVPGGKYTGSSQEMANLNAENHLRTDHTPLSPSSCSTGLFATASINITSYYYSYNYIFPNQHIIDFLQKGSVVASCHIPFNNVGSQSPINAKLLYLPPGEYQLSFRPSADTRYDDAFLSYYFNADDEGYMLVLHQGDTINLVGNNHYSFFTNYDMFND